MDVFPNTVFEDLVSHRVPQYPGVLFSLRNVLEGPLVVGGRVWVRCLGVSLGWFQLHVYPDRELLPAGD